MGMLGMSSNNRQALLDLAKFVGEGVEWWFRGSVR